MSLAVDARSVTKTFGAATVLAGVDLLVAPGEVVMLAGPSGSGKTTLLSILGCVLRPSAGALSLYGKDVTALRESDLPQVRRQMIGFIFQGHNLIASLTAQQNVAFQMQMRGFSRAAARDEAGRLLDRVGLHAKRNLFPSALSGGERQRVAVARAVIGGPPLILADEPTASLDLENGIIVTQLLAELATEGGHTVIIVTHDRRIFEYADRIEHLENGRMVRGEEASIPNIRISRFLEG